MTTRIPIQSAAYECALGWDPPMSRFTGAARALRGPFKKLIRKLETTMRRTAIKKLGWVGRVVGKRQGSKDARAALRAAQQEAARLRSGRRPPAAASAAVDRTTGRVVAVGHCRHSTPVPPQLSAKDGTLFPPCDNCNHWVPGKD